MTNQRVSRLLANWRRGLLTDKEFVEEMRLWGLELDESQLTVSNHLERIEKQLDHHVKRMDGLAKRTDRLASRYHLFQLHLESLVADQMAETEQPSSPNSTPSHSL